MEDQINAVGFGRFHILAVTTFILFIISDGMELVVTNVIWRAMPVEEWGGDDSMRALLVSLSFSGFVVGAIIGGQLGDTFGRKPILYAHTMVFVPLSIASATSESFYQLAVTRFLIGISMGLVLPTSVALMAELSPCNVRSRLILLIPGLAYAVGQVIVLTVGIVLMGYYGWNCEKCSWWRGMLVAGVVPDVVAVLMVYLYIPESPRFLLSQGRTAEAEAIIRSIAETNGTESQLLHQGAIRPVKEEHDKAEASMEAWQLMGELFKPPMNRILPLVVGIWSLLAVGLFSQSFAYPVLLERDPTITAFDQYWLMIQLAFIEIPGLVVLIWALEGTHVGRREILLVLSLASVVVAGIMIMISDKGTTWLHLGSMGLRLMVVLPYEAMYIFAAELLPTSHRNLGLSLGNGATKLVAALMPLVLMPLIHLWGASVFLVILLAEVLAAVLVWVSPHTDDVLYDCVEEMPKTVNESAPLLPKDATV